MNRIKRWLIGSKRYADYMRQFHNRDDGTQTIMHRIAECLWYAQLASNWTMPIEHAGYGEEYDNLYVYIDGVQYEVILKAFDE